MTSATIVSGATPKKKYIKRWIAEGEECFLLRQVTWSECLWNRKGKSLLYGRARLP